MTLVLLLSRASSPLIDTALSLVTSSLAHTEALSCTAARLVSDPGSHSLIDSLNSAAPALSPTRHCLVNLSVCLSIPYLLLPHTATMAESREGIYSHISEPPAAGEEATLPLFRRSNRRPVSPAFRALLVAALVVLALALLTLAITLLVNAAEVGGGGGSGGGGGGYPARRAKCSTYPAFNLTNRRPDPSIRSPAPRTFDVNHT